ncbi:phage terminase small subunit P27 family [Alkalibacillus almallahensis]|uniref:phage terminase small subunit P27 family n=1 Tax=Alkalibacillus almallahensis TaxID=1379154 RepID=UPI00141F9B43|nr:phage terminase small subunit P27 family [Alkalibacillus almallahensis]NIK10914.1 P27 family predicted phage terminase small subunit [Alkalibacillus almallahensis]
MPGRKQLPLSVIEGKGRSNHITKEEARERKQQEERMKADTDKVEPPSYLTKKQKEEFEDIAQDLIALEIFSNLDVDGLARYLDSRTEYIRVAKELKKINPAELVETEEGHKKRVANDQYEILLRVKNKLFNECKSAASELGLSITSRLKLVIPKQEDKKPQSEAERRFGDSV